MEWWWNCEVESLRVGEVEVPNPDIIPRQGKKANQTGTIEIVLPTGIIETRQQ